ncbi:hypothetical protein Tco_1245835 [Tanacetum coccineum]
MTQDHPLEQYVEIQHDSSNKTTDCPQILNVYVSKLHLSIVELKNIKDAMADSAWIEAMQEELHQFDRLKVWELVDKPFSKMIIKLKCSTLEAFGFRYPTAAHKSFPNLSDLRKNDHFKCSLKYEVYMLQPEGSLDPDHPENGKPSRKLCIDKASSNEPPNFRRKSCREALILAQSTSGGIQFLGDKLMGIMPTKIELTLEQSQQGVSNDVLISIEGVEELKRNVWIKGLKKEALHTT